MSLALADQKLGSRSAADSTSHKFMLKGRQSGAMHRGHSWVFRAESYDTMLAWYDDIKNLTEKTGAERNAFIQRSHARSLSAGSHRAGSVSSDGMEEDEADQVPYSATASQAEMTIQQEKLPERPKPGGRFPSALQIDNRDSQVALSPSSNESAGDHEVVAAAAALPGAGVAFDSPSHQVQTSDNDTKLAGGGPQNASTAPLKRFPTPSTGIERDYNALPVQDNDITETEKGNSNKDSSTRGPGFHSDAHNSSEQEVQRRTSRSLPHHAERHDSKYGDVR